MKYSLDIYIITNSQTIIDTIKTNIPNKLDAVIWANEFSVSDGVNLKGNKYVDAIVRFNNISDRKVINDKIRERFTPAVLSQILAGSYIHLHTCNHDDDNRTAGCVETEIWSK